jgi:hypothetical protein
VYAVSMKLLILFEKFVDSIDSNPALGSVSIFGQINYVQDARRTSAAPLPNREKNLSSPLDRHLSLILSAARVHSSQLSLTYNTFYKTRREKQLHVDDLLFSYK